MMPAYVPNPVAAAFGGGMPIDRGAILSDGKRLFGDGKTYRGFITGVSAGILVGLFEIWLRGDYGWGSLPKLTLTAVVLLSIGALLGDLGKSFVKRRIGKDRGERWIIADQYDLVVGAFLIVILFDFSWFVSVMTIQVLLVILIITPLLHKGVNVIGYITGIKKVPW
jgi:CDP-2,3-bis-(O-geranylgeranyl)-sn-glycerol synthase